jgi:hypothetical protein
MDCGFSITTIINDELPFDSAQKITMRERLLFQWSWQGAVE